MAVAKTAVYPAQFRFRREDVMPSPSTSGPMASPGPSGPWVTPRLRTVGVETTELGEVGPYVDQSEASPTAPS